MSETGIEVGEFTPEPEPEQTLFYRLALAAVAVSTLLILTGVLA